MAWAALVRSDRGGLAQQTAELCRHVVPDRALVVDVDTQRRGEIDTARYAHVPAVRVHRGDVIDDQTLGQFLDGVDVLFSAECFYSATFDRIAREAGCRTILQPNAELLSDDWLRADDLALPTSWEQNRIASRRADIGLPAPWPLPVPVARDRLPPRDHDGRFATIYHPSSNAMGDRNGTKTLLDAVRITRASLRVIIRSGSGARPSRRLGRSTVEILGPVHDYADQYPD